MYILFSEKCLEYWSPGHPESPDRVYQTYKLLVERNYKFVQPEPCGEEDLLLVHSKNYVESIKSESFFDPDTPALPGIYEYARLAAGSAIKSMEIALSGDLAFSLMRPPGHHAGVDGKALNAPTLGFCYFNNIAIACKKALQRVNKVAIIDIDCHHGNGTQEIFLGEPRVLFVSLHRFGGVYPGTGAKSIENCLNYPFIYAVGDDEYMRVLGKALEEVEKFDPDLIAVSAGFDTYKYDPVCSLGLSMEVYIRIGRAIAGLNRKTFAVLEGGYGRDMPRCVLNFLIGLEQK
ncbi:MAG: histone deacetylase [Candidatus Bathyarchaeia archaeon]